MDFSQPVLIAFSLMLVLEGIISFLYPGSWRQLVARLAEVADRQLMLAGMASMQAGLVLLYRVNG